MAAIFLAVTAAYWNHFGNSFHFDDSHAVEQNVYIRSLDNIPRFFTDMETTSVLPANRTFRPLLFCTLAIDYALGGSLKPFYFHLTTFLAFLLQLWLMYVLFRHTFDKVSPATNNALPALFGAALYGLHPAMAETVNYVIQRADLYSTLAVIGAMVVWLRFPAQRKFGFYLLVMAAGVLFKPPTLMFAAILPAYLWLIEGDRPGTAIRRSVPALVGVAAMGWLTAAMTPRTFAPGGGSAFAYRITQPVVIFRYFRAFFAPVDLTADTDRMPIDNLLDGQVILGLLFLALLVWAITRCSKSVALRPIGFGLTWFILAVLPTSIQVLAEVENDHRMFFPFVGLAMAFAWGCALLVRKKSLQPQFVALASVILLTGFGVGVRERNAVWHTEETLWRDVTQKSPTNGRGLMNYGLTLMARGDTQAALGYFERALVYNPRYYVLEVNLGVALGALNRPAEAETHFKRALEFAPAEAVSHFFYARWLNDQGRPGEAVGHLEIIGRDNPTYVQGAYLLMQILASQADGAGVKRVAEETLRRFPGDVTARSWLSKAESMKPTPESHVNQSFAFYRQGRFEDSIRECREAIRLRPDYAPAWNNLMAAYNSLGQWDQAIEAGRKAIQLNPNDQLTKNNLAWAMSRKKASK